LCKKKDFSKKKTSIKDLEVPNMLFSVCFILLDTKYFIDTEVFGCTHFERYYID